MSLDVLATYLTEAALQDGGATVSLTVDPEWNAVVTPTTGYAVGRPPYGAVFGPGTSGRAVTLRRAILEWLGTLPSDVTHVGIWRDDHTGRVHVDVVDVITVKSVAHGYAVRRGELAYYDLGRSEEVRLLP